MCIWVLIMANVHRIYRSYYHSVHLSTRTFDIGNVDLNNETMKRIELGFDWQSDRLTFKVNGFYNWIEDFIYQQNTGLFYEIDNEVIRQRCVSEAECLPIYAYDQRDATFVGYEAEATVPLFESPFANVSLTVFSDYVRARFKTMMCLVFLHYAMVRN